MSNRYYTDNPLADDPWAEGIAKFLSNQTETSVADVLDLEIGKHVSLWKPVDQERVQRILQALGWKRVREGDQFTLKYRRTVASNVPVTSNVLSADNVPRADNDLRPEAVRPVVTASRGSRKIDGKSPAVAGKEKGLTAQPSRRPGKRLEIVMTTRIAADTATATPAVVKSPKRQEQSSRRDCQREVPRITALGYEVGPGWYGWSKTDPPDPQQVEACRHFLSLCERTKTRNIHSYWLKHKIERAVNTYVSNGACLQACRDLGIAAPRATKATRPTPYGWVAVSLRSVRSVAKILALNVR